MNPLQGPLLAEGEVVAGQGELPVGEVGGGAPDVVVRRAVIPRHQLG